jgi:FMN-dependent NADH-azoreductase
VVEQIRATQPDLEVTYRDLVADPLPHLTQDVWTSLDSGAEVQQFLDADVVVIGAGFYNFSIPSQLKSWIDRIAVRGKTFAYGENGPVGLATGTRVIICLARGNVYAAGTPYAAFEHGETLLASLFGFIGASAEFIIADGIGFGDDARRAFIEAAIAQAGRIAKTVRETASA